MWQMFLLAPEIVTLGLAIILFTSRRFLRIRLNQQFFILLGTDLAVMFFDYLATWLDMHYQPGIRSLIYMLNWLFFLCFIIRGFAFLDFTLTLMNGHSSDDHMNRRLIVQVPMIISLIILGSDLVTHLIFNVTQTGYVSGPLYPFINATFIYCTLMMLYVCHSSINTHEISNHKGGYYYTLTLLAGIMTRIVLPHLVVMNTFCNLALLIILFYFVNPDIVTDYNTEAFNETGLSLYLATAIHQPKHLIGICIRKFSRVYELYNDELINESLSAISHYLMNLKGISNVFYIKNGRFIVESDLDIKTLMTQIDNRFHSPWETATQEISFSVNYINIENLDQIESDKQVTCIHYAFAAAQDENIKLVTVNEDTIKKLREQVKIEDLLNAAIKDYGIAMFIQPIVRASDEKVVGGEALARLPDGYDHYIPPFKFIPVSEKNGTIGALGEQMFMKACTFMQEHTGDLEWLNVNLAPAQCVSQELSQRYLRILEATGVDPHKMKLEITEESMIDPDLLRLQIDVFKSYGIQFALDDFGSEYSNILRLVHNSFDNVKLDRELIVRHFEHPDDILKKIIDIIKSRGMTITAEGVETKEMADALREMGVDYFQGFYYDRPLPPDQFVKKYCQKTDGQYESSASSTSSIFVA